MDTENPTRAAGALLTLSALLGALLLFEMEPLVGRLLVPYYGGAVSTWLTALMFFQVVLFFGYLYAHLVAPRIGRWHLLLLLLPLAFVPLTIYGEVTPEAPMGRIVLALIVSIGVPFFVLSTSAVVVQVWWESSALGRVREPYPLYAASNAGSLIALLSYPFVFEPLMGLRAQGLVWTVGYLIYAVGLTAAWFKVRPELPAAPGEAPPPTEAPPTVANLALWALLAALPSGFLLAVTAVIATEVGSFPMVWILPLGTFLLTFVLIFRDRPIGMGLRGYWPEISALGLLAFALPTMLVLQIVVFFLYCMAVHGELYARRPAPRWLTRYYLAISFGGGVGGAVVNFGPPVWFDGYWEYPFLVLAFAVLFAALRGRALVQALKKATVLVGAARMLAFQGVLGVAMFGFLHFYQNPALDSHRNFYGIFRVVETETSRVLVHGATNHGSQYLDPARRHVPTSYFHLGGGLHDAYEAVPGARRIAVLGLGAGVVAAYAREGDVMDFFEIDPDNEAIARAWFTWLEDTPAQVSVYVGDGRLKMLTEVAATEYDLIHLDAFSGDGIPTHLLTVEAVHGYLSRLKDDGLLLFHISNRYYNLRPIVEAIAAANGLTVVHNPFVPAGGPGDDAHPSMSAVASRNPEALAALRARGWIDLPATMPVAEPWTDDYINVLWPLYWKRTLPDWPR